jgi:hypothetical protein
MCVGGWVPKCFEGGFLDNFGLVAGKYAKVRHCFLGDVAQFFNLVNVVGLKDAEVVLEVVLLEELL